MLTARGFAVEDKEKEELEISELLSKPFSPKELLRSIEDILYQRAVMRNK
jgi:DNA-binding response OmpR family regulator